MCCMFFQVVLLPLEVSHLLLKNRSWALCTCWRERASPSGTSAASVLSHQGFVPDLQALTSRSHDCGPIITTCPGAVTFSPYIWADTPPGLFIQSNLRYSYRCCGSCRYLRCVKRWYWDLCSYLEQKKQKTFSIHYCNESSLLTTLNIII